MDIYFDIDEYDAQLSGSDLRMTTDDELIQSRIKAFLQMNLGSWFLNTARGIPFTQSIIEPNVDNDKVNMMLRTGIKSLEGVEIVNDLQLQINKRDRVLSGTVIVNQNITVEV